MPQATIDTKTIPSRRTLHFDAISAAIAEADRLAGADRAGKLKQLGNWTFGQNLGHLASWVDYSFDGPPMTVPGIVRFMIRPFRRRFLYRPMAPGRKLPKAKTGTFGTEPLSTEEGLSRFRTNFNRIAVECPKIPNILFGPLTHDEWINLHLRHAELHLSFSHEES
jgi:hypothetical protein